MPPPEDSSAKDLLEAYRRDRMPSLEARERMWKGIDGRLPPPPSRGGAGLIAKVGSALVALGVAAWVLSPIASAPEKTGSPEPATPPAGAEPPAVERAVEPAAPAAPDPGTDEDVTTVDHSPPSGPTAARAQARSPTKRSRTRLSRPHEVDALDLEREVDEFRAAQQLHRRGDLDGALAALRDHRNAFPRSVLSQERSLLEIQILCQSDRRDAARDAADRFESTWPQSHLRGKLPAACLSEQEK